MQTFFCLCFLHNGIPSRGSSGDKYIRMPSNLKLPSIGSQRQRQSRQDTAGRLRCRRFSPLPIHTTHLLAMQSIRSSLSRRALQASAVPRSFAAQRPLSSTSQLRSAESHDDHFNPPGGWLFGVKPGEKYENEGWEKIWYWGFFGSMAFGVIGYCYKPDTRCVAGSNTTLCV